MFLGHLTVVLVKLSSMVLSGERCVLFLAARGVNKILAKEERNLRIHMVLNHLFPIPIFLWQTWALAAAKSYQYRRGCTDGEKVDKPL